MFASSFISQKSRYVSQLIAEEFWTQGDIERQELNVEPQPMFDRSVALSTVQIGNTPRPNRAVGSIQWTNTFDFKILKYTIKIIENAKFQNILACTLFVMVIFGYLRGQFFWNFFVFSWIFSDFFYILGSKSVQIIK